MTKYCIQTTNLSNGEKLVISGDFGSEQIARQIMRQKMARMAHIYEITEKAENYFCYRTPRAEMMMQVIDTNLKYIA